MNDLCNMQKSGDVNTNMYAVSEIICSKTCGVIEYKKDASQEAHENSFPSFTSETYLDTASYRVNLTQNSCNVQILFDDYSRGLHSRQT